MATPLKPVPLKPAALLPPDPTVVGWHWLLDQYGAPHVMQWQATNSSTVGAAIESSFRWLVPGYGAFTPEVAARSGYSYHSAIVAPRHATAMGGLVAAARKVTSTANACMRIQAESSGPLCPTEAAQISPVVICWMPMQPIADLEASLKPFTPTT